MQARLGDALELGLAVLAVDEDAVGQHLDAVADAGEPLGDLAVAVAAEAHLEHLARRVAADELGGGALGHDRALVDDHEPIAELLGLVHVVGGEQQRGALLLEAEQPVPEDMCRACGSRPVVGSSSSSTRGSLISACARW